MALKPSWEGPGGSRIWFRKVLRVPKEEALRSEGPRSCLGTSFGSSEEKACASNTYIKHLFLMIRSGPIVKTPNNIIKIKVILSNSIIRNKDFSIELLKENFKLATS